MPKFALPNVETSFAFSINYDYRCPFARNLNEHVVEALKSDPDLTVTFVPFNLSQVHVDEGNPPIWEDPDKSLDLLANEVGYIVSELFPEKFPEVHLSIFGIRHELRKSLKDRTELAKVLVAHGVDESEVFQAVDQHTYSDKVRALHEDQAQRLEVFGVPTIFDDEKAAFVRVMNRPSESSESSKELVLRILNQIFCYPEINELKHTRLDR